MGKQALEWNPQLLFHKNSLRTKLKDNQNFIFCRLRKTWLVLQPEEMVRQLVINYLLEEKQIREKSIQVEKSINVNTSDRIDLAVYGKGSTPFLLIECKTWDAELDRQAIHQISRYNLDYQFPNCWVTNGKTNIMYTYSGIEQEYSMLSQFPDGYK